MSDTAQSPAAEKRTPVKTFRCRACSVSIWDRRTQQGEIFYSAKAQRAWKDERANEWKYSDAFNFDDLPVVAELLRLAFAWIEDAEQAKRNQKAPF